jgi:hypothetical protein
MRGSCRWHMLSVASDATSNRYSRSLRCYGTDSRRWRVWWSGQLFSITWEGASSQGRRHHSWSVMMTSTNGLSISRIRAGGRNGPTSVQRGIRGHLTTHWSCLSIGERFHYRRPVVMAATNGLSISGSRRRSSPTQFEMRPTRRCWIVMYYPTDSWGVHFSVVSSSDQDAANSGISHC